MNEQEQYRPMVALYRCTCRHCDAAEDELSKLSERHGVVLLETAP